MAQDLAALAPSVIVCVAFLIGAGLLVRHEMAPKRRARAAAEDGSGELRATDDDEGSES
jgi:hypothetical protein